MASNGNSHTNKLFREYLWKDKLIPILETDSEFDLWIKTRINNFIAEHGYTFKQYGRSSKMHSEWRNLIININQFRLKHWYFKSLKVK